MKRVLIVLAMVLCVVLAGCGNGGSDAVQEAAPEDVVRSYFAAWGERDQATMDQMVLESQRIEGENPDVVKMKTLKLTKCERASTEGEEWNSELYTDPYQFAYVDVAFSVTFDDGEGGGYVDGEYESRFTLIQEEEGAPWVIVTWGLG